MAGSAADTRRAVDLADVRSVYYRRPSRFVFPEGMSGADRAFAAAEAQLGLGGLLAALRVPRWMNDPVHTAYAEYKPVQLRVAVESGLAVPCTLVTNDQAAARTFAAEVGGRIVCKTFSSVALSERGQVQLTYTTPVDVAEVDPAALASTAHLLQEWVPKRFDARVTMVGDQPFAVAIHAGSAASHVDWRRTTRP